MTDPTRRIDHLAVVIPAADEQDVIGACLAAVAASARELCNAPSTPGRATPTVDVVVVLDGCRDGTAAIVAAAGVHAVATRWRGVGNARELGCRAATARSTAGMDRTLLCNTDADSAVPEHWLGELWHRAETGADVVLGTVSPTGLGEPFASRWRKLHPDRDGHRHVHGANLGVRASVLRSLGGWSPVPSGEDVALAGAARAAGYTVVAVGGLAVTTSARTSGRAVDGFAAYLAALQLG